MMANSGVGMEKGEHLLLVGMQIGAAIMIFSVAFPPKARTTSTT